MADDTTTPDDLDEPDDDARSRWHPERSPILRFVRRRSVRMTVAAVLVALLGAGLGVVLGGTVHHKVGPVEATFRLRLGTSGGTRVGVPPLGNISLRDHEGPLRLRISIDQVDVKQVQALISSTESNDQIGDRLAKDVRSAVIELAIRSSLSALAGALVLSVLVFRRPRPAAIAAVTTVVLVVVSGGTAAASFRTSALSEPRFSGLLASAPAAIGDVQDIAARFTAYREELAKLVTNVSKLYDVASTLPADLPSANTIPVLWVSDIHDNIEAFNVMSSLITQFHVAAVVDSGDLSDHGTALENQLYAPIATLGVPYVYVKGNHDSADQTVASISKYKNVTVLDDSEKTVAGLRFTGIGDPRFTPNKTAPTTSDQSALLSAYGARLAAEAESTQADVAVIHDPAMSAPLFGHVPLVLAGHLHRRDVQTGNGTLMLTQGSTGGAGLRGLEGAQPLPLDASVLYFDATTHRLIAYDDVTVGGLGLTSVQIQRHAVTNEIKGGTNPVPPSVGPAASPAPSILPTFAPDTSGPSDPPASTGATASATPSNSG
ncbi:metallophosphoesterase [Acidothermaceae bacterium B102]|nr:metallophosphoesterase [Acidothermaceae bacterium B102]